ncbi:hypothetical protein V9T40_009215 [Parthenolecanium corni]|uniref:Uncharacterized protein n=1 Tax=Parthenolecanium corni TaxID=536013 RepID=A0AAN9Y7X6_9HEMI
MGDQKFTCGRYKNRTFEDIANEDADFCDAVLKSPVSNKYYPEEFKSYLLSLGKTTVTSISAVNVTGFVSQWDEKIRAEFQQIIGSSDGSTIREVHPKSTGYSYGNLGVFIRFFIKKCIFNVQNANAVNLNIELFASIFPFKVSKTVPSVKLPVRKLFDKQFNGTIAKFMVHHFEDKCERADSYIDLFLANVNHFRMTFFNEGSMQRLKKAMASQLDLDSSPFGMTGGIPYISDYLKKFPRLNQKGVARYKLLRRMYNKLCTTFGQEDLGEQSPRQIRMLPEINCYELFSLLEPDFFVDQRAKYVERFLKYLFFFIYAVENSENHPLFFIDDPLYECLKGYAEYRDSRQVPENLKLCIWKMALVYRRYQEVENDKSSVQFEVDDENLQNIRNYMENFPAIETAIVDFRLPTDLLVLGISVVTTDTTFRMYYRKTDRSNLSDFHEDIIRALMCPMDIKKAIIYNAFTGVEASLIVPPLKTEIWEFVRRYNEYNPNGPDAFEDLFALSVEGILEG